jgi:ABC-2 type transport system permease protein
MGSVAECLPTTYVFEGMRSLLLDGVWRPELVVRAFGLNLLYIALGVACFLFSFRIARKHGLLLQSGE